MVPFAARDRFIIIFLFVGVTKNIGFRRNECPGFQWMLD